MKAIFIDKDGTLIENVPYNVDPERVELSPGAGPALARLSAAGFHIFVVSNQAGVALGRFPESALGAVEAKIRLLLADYAVRLDGFYYCPHHPEGTVRAYRHRCDCRKPAAGLLKQASIEHGIDLSRSFLVGDILDDIEAGHRAGCQAVLLDRGHEAEWRLSPLRDPDARVSDFDAAVRWILDKEGRA